MLKESYAFQQFLCNWMNENRNYHCDWCWTKTSVYKNGEDVTEDLLKLMQIELSKKQDHVGYQPYGDCGDPPGDE